VLSPPVAAWSSLTRDGEQARLCPTRAFFATLSTCGVLHQLARSAGDKPKDKKTCICSLFAAALQICVPGMFFAVFWLMVLREKDGHRFLRQIR
jgi:hypothetical protein